jgi:hypothetical protein
LGNGDAIDYNVINPLIAQLNKLEDSNNAQVWYNFSDQYVQNSLDDKMVTVAMRKTFSIPATAAYYNGFVVSIPFSVKFTEPPVVTATMDNYGNLNGEGAYLIPYLSAVSGSNLNLGILRVGNGWPALPKQSAVNIIAVGPTGQAF